MFTAKKYLKLFAITNEEELEKEISKISESDAKQFVKTTVMFFQRYKVDVQELFRKQ